MAIEFLQRSTASDNQPGEIGLWFGYNVDIDNDWAIVGYPFQLDTGSGFYTGKVYFFKLENGVWVEKQSFIQDTPIAAGGFGDSVAIDGDTAIVANASVSSGGEVYVYLKTGDVWAKQQILSGLPEAGNDFFGSSTLTGPKGCDISGDTIVVGASSSDLGGVNRGRVYVFTRSGSTWTEQQNFQATGVTDGTRFGTAVGIHNDTIIVGTYLYDGTYAQEGRVWIFKRTGTTWSEEQVIAAPVKQVNGYFGWSVDVDGDNAIIGAIGLDDPIANVGQTYIYTRTGTTWSLDSTFRATNYATVTNDNFGLSVRIKDTNAIIGASFDEDPDSPPIGSYGAFYHLTKTNEVWSLSERIFPSVVGEIGTSVGLTTINSDVHFIIGAPTEEDNDVDQNQWGYARFYWIDNPDETSSTSDSGIGLQFTTNRIDTIISASDDQEHTHVIRPQNVWNEFDEHINLVSLPRNPGEKNWNYKRRGLAEMAKLANSSSLGLTNGITRALGLTQFEAIIINPKINESSSFIAPDPLVLIQGPKIYLYSDFANSEYIEIDRFEAGGNYEHLGSLITYINTSTYFEAHLIPGVNPYTKSITIFNQSNRIVVDAEDIQYSSRFFIKPRLVPGSVFFSDKIIFASEKTTETEVVGPGHYYIDYVNGFIRTYSVSSSLSRIRYSYTKYPFTIMASPIVLYDLNSTETRQKIFEQVVSSNNGSQYNNIPTKLGADWINELISVKSNSWGE